jgi:excisionase family DNA binding protein
MERYMSVSDAAKTLGVHPQTIYRMLWGEQIPGVIRVGRAIRIPESALELFPRYATPGVNAG